MGVYCPASGMTFSEDFPKETGRIALISQSGAEASRLIFLCQDVNLYFSKVVNYGNAADLDAPELLEYLTQDTETDIIALYIEGVKNNHRFHIRRETMHEKETNHHTQGRLNKKWR